VSASKDGVWVAYAGGNLGAIQHLRAGDLKSLPVAHRATSNAVQVRVIAQVVWLIDGGTQHVACLGPRDGSESAAWDNVNAIDLGGDINGVYLGTTDGLYQVNVDPRCQP
jgi:hypothetical protein